LPAAKQYSSKQPWGSTTEGKTGFSVLKGVFAKTKAV